MPDEPPKKKTTRKKPVATKAAADALASILPMPGVTPTPPPAGEPPPAAKPVLLDRSEQLRKIVENPPPRPSTAAFLDHWFALSGGPAQFALDLRIEYDAAPAGSQIRQRIIEVVMRAMGQTDKKEGETDNLGLISDDDLFRMLQQVGERILAAEDAKGK